MKVRAHALRSLIAAFDGHLPSESEWTGVLKTANRGWLGPALYLSLEAAARLDDVPLPVRDYLAFLHERNLDRNLRLRAQLIKATKILNADGIQPVLLKGAIGLFSSPREKLGSRMLSDLDISIDRSEREQARAALMNFGYTPTANSNELGRPDDVGTIELHDTPNARYARYLAADLRSSSTPVETDGAVALVPNLTCRALHLIVHDMIKEGDYWRLTIDLRHLKDLADLARSPAGIDWGHLREVLNDETGRHALEVQAIALHDLFGVQTSQDLCSRRAELKHSARLMACTGGLIGSPLRALGKLSWGIHRMASGYVWRGTHDFSERVWRIVVTSRKGSNL